MKENKLDCVWTYNGKFFKTDCNKRVPLPYDYDQFCFCGKKIKLNYQEVNGGSV